MVRSVKYLGFIRDNKPSSISTPHMSINTADKDFCRPQTLSAFNPFFTLVPSGGRCRQHISFKKRGLGRNFVFSAIRGFEKPEHTVMFLNVSLLLVYVPCSGCRFCALCRHIFLYVGHQNKSEMYFSKHQCFFRI